ncbi:MAG: hypothetical protein PF689_00175 [Deltaproteobacteria bacterium]|nr:hypothetical protein [Deltaproteobacteria bacterium]
MKLLLFSLILVFFSTLGGCYDKITCCPVDGSCEDSSLDTDNLDSDLNHDADATTQDATDF